MDRRGAALFYRQYRRRLRQMIFQSLILAIGGILLMWLNVSNSVIVHYSEGHHKEALSVGDGSKGHIVCNCKGREESQVLSDASIDAVFKSIQEHNFCGYKDTTRICKFLQECNNCTAQVERCIPTKDGSFDCLKKVIEMRDRYFINLNSYKGSQAVLRRNLRQASRTCLYPKTMKTADLFIVVFSNYTAVTERCIFGHTLKEGISRDVRCYFERNKWEPTGFEECQPFVDCTIRLISPGNLTCTKASSRQGPKCNVSCDHFEDQEAVPDALHECHIEGGWEPKLPYCATGGSGLHLVPAPKVKLHPDEAE